MPTRVLRDWTDSETMDGMSAEGERLFARLLMKADDYGRFHAEQRRVKSALFPLSDSVTAADCGKWIKEISKRDLVMLYEVDGKQYLVINKFGQRMRNSVPKFPPPVGMPVNWRPDGGDSPQDDSGLPQDDSNPPQVAASCGELPQVAASCGLSREPRAESREPRDESRVTPTHRAREGQSSVLDAQHIANILDDPDFKAIHAEYPPKRRIAARVAAQAFAGLDPPAVLPDVLAGLRRLKGSGDWNREGGRFVPGMVRWIEARGWEEGTQCKRQRKGW